MPNKKTCFVIQGFGKKTDFQTGRVLDLDKSYAMVKLAVESAGLECTRADEIPHSGSIDRVMYENILNADLVVADLSTSNLNAAYELGIRHALRPHTTIVIAEDQLKFPFDLNHIVIRPYRHLGEDVGFEEVLRFKDEMAKAIDQILAGAEVDSPVYTFLDALQPPSLGAAEGREMAAAAAPPESDSARALMEAAAAAREAGNWSQARDILTGVRALRPNDDFVVQQLALATYMAEQPTPEAALAEAERLLGESLTPETSHDPETLALWSAIRTRLWDLTQDPDHLATAIKAREGAFNMRGDWGNGIILAFLLTLRSTLSEPADAIADWVLAARIRTKVAAAAEGELADGHPDPSAGYALRATLWEAAVGLGDDEAATRWEAEARNAAPEPSLVASTETQIANLRALLTESPLHLIGKED